MLVRTEHGKGLPQEVTDKVIVCQRCEAWAYAQGRIFNVNITGFRAGMPYEIRWEELPGNSIKKEVLREPIAAFTQWHEEKILALHNRLDTLLRSLDEAEAFYSHSAAPAVFRDARQAVESKYWAKINEEEASIALLREWTNEESGALRKALKAAKE